MGVDPDIWVKVFERDNGTCQYCDADLLATFSSFQSATVDHVVAVSAGGSDDPENLRLACPCCNALLSRSAALTTHAERRALVQRSIASKWAWYAKWCADLGRQHP